jgi:hypothetical protein
MAGHAGQLAISRHTCRIRPAQMRHPLQPRRHVMPIQKNWLPPMFRATAKMSWEDRWTDMPAGLHFTQPARNGGGNDDDDDDILGLSGTRRRLQVVTRRWTPRQNFFAGDATARSTASRHAISNIHGFLILTSVTSET